MATAKQSASKTRTLRRPAAKPDERTLNPHEIVMFPAAQSAAAIHAWSKFAGEASVSDLIKDLRKQIKDLQAGDMREVEAMLYGQAVTLQTIFTSLARKAVAQDYLKQFQVNLTLALKAQAQCRATLEALAEIKNPRPVLITKQANIASGNQQVNNCGTPPVPDRELTQTGTVRAGAHAHVVEIFSQQNELLEAPNGNQLDTRTAGTSGRDDSHLETMGTSYRAAHS